MVIHSSILTERIPWTEEPGGPQSMGSQRVGHNWNDLACTPPYLAEHNRTQWSWPALATGRNSRNTYILFRGDNMTQTSVFKLGAPFCCCFFWQSFTTFRRAPRDGHPNQEPTHVPGDQDSCGPFPEALSLLGREHWTEKSFPKIESELLNSRPDGFLSHVYVYSHCSHYLQNRQEGYLAFDKKKTKSKSFPQIVYKCPQFHTFHCYSMKVKVSHWVECNSFWPHGPTRLLCPWNSPGKNTGVGSHSLLQGIFPTQGSKVPFVAGGYFTTEPPGKPFNSIVQHRSQWPTEI